MKRLLKEDQFLVTVKYFVGWWRFECFGKKYQKYVHTYVYNIILCKIIYTEISNIHNIYNKVE